MKKILLLALVLLASTGVASAQQQGDTQFFYGSSFGQPASQSAVTSAPASSGSTGGITDLNSLVRFIIAVINTGIYLIIAFATIVFIWNIIKYFVVEREGDRAEAGKYLMYSIIGLVVIFSFWGLVNVVIRTFGLNNSRPNVENLYINR